MRFCAFASRCTTPAIRSSASVFLPRTTSNGSTDSHTPQNSAIAPRIVGSFWMNFGSFSRPVWYAAKVFLRRSGRPSSNAITTRVDRRRRWRRRGRSRLRRRLPVARDRPQHRPREPEHRHARVPLRRVGLHRPLERVVAGPRQVVAVDDQQHRPSVAARSANGYVDRRPNEWKERRRNWETERLTDASAVQSPAWTAPHARSAASIST